MKKKWIPMKLYNIVLSLEFNNLGLSNKVDFNKLIIFNKGIYDGQICILPSKNGQIANPTGR